MTCVRCTVTVAALVAATVALLALLLPGVAVAHPEVTNTVPGDGATLARVPDEISVTFGLSLIHISEPTRPERIS